MIKITPSQINPTIGDISGNLAMMEEEAIKALAQGSQIIVFGELSLTAYYPADLLDEERFQRRLSEGIDAMLRATLKTPGLRWVVGVPTHQPGMGKKFHNSLLVIRDGAVERSYHKQLLPTYNIFDERRHFEPGPDVACVLRIGSAQIGFMICEDGWNDEGKDYAVNPFERLAQACPDLVVSINASPSNIGKREQRHEIFSKACARHEMALLYVNQVGGHDQLIFDGASFALDAKGALAWEAQRFESDTTTLCFDTEARAFLALDGSPIAPPAREGLPTMEFYRRQIILGLRDYARRCGFRQVVVGSSGGIDSALTIALAAEALGAENVTAITMPSEYSSAGSVGDSVTLCATLGVKLLEHPILELVEAYKKQFGITMGEPLEGLALENLQARIRGTILMEHSNSYGNLLLTTGNKSEISVGYSTLYGDSNGGLGLIGDLYKTEIFELCRHINASAGSEIIPTVIIEKPPSAELAPGQKDTDSLPPYEILDEILKVLVEGERLAKAEQAHAKQAVAELEASEAGRAIIARVMRMISRNEYKRKQSPPILRVRSKSFGSGRQMPIAAVHD